LKVVQIVFLGVSFIPGSGSNSAWMNWAMMFVTPIFLLPLLVHQLHYPRLFVDQPTIKVGKFEKLGC